MYSSYSFQCVAQVVHFKNLKCSDLVSNQFLNLSKRKIQSNVEYLVSKLGQVIHHSMFILCGAEMNNAINNSTDHLLNVLVETFICIFILQQIPHPKVTILLSFYQQICAKQLKLYSYRSKIRSLVTLFNIFYRDKKPSCYLCDLTNSLKRMIMKCKHYFYEALVKNQIESFKLESNMQNNGNKVREIA